MNHWKALRAELASSIHADRMDARALFKFLVLSLLLLSGLLVGLSSMATPREVRVGVYANSPKIFMDDQGHISGILGDLLTEIAEREHWTLQPVPCAWQTCLQDLSSGRIDLMPDLAYNTERAKLFDFNKTAVLQSWSEIYSASNVKINTVLDLRGKRLAVLAGSVQEAYLRSLLQEFDVQAELIPVQSFKQGFELVAAGKADATAANHLYGDAAATQYLLNTTPIMFQPAQIFYATRRGTHAGLLVAIDRYLGEWRNDPDSPYARILQKWTGQVTPPNAIPVWVWWGAGGLLTLLALALLGSIVLRREVRTKTRHLVAERAQLARSEVQYRNLTENSSDWIWATDADGMFTYTNSRVKQMLGYERDTLLHTDATDLIHPDDRPIYRHTLKRVAVSRTGWHGLLLRWRAKDGSYRSLESNASPMIDSHGLLVGFHGINRDITERKAAEQAIAETRNLLLTIINTTRIRVFWKDLNLRYLGCNTVFAHDAGKNDPDELIGKNDFDMAWAAQAEAYRADDQTVIDSGQARLFYEEPQTTSDGQTIWLRTSKVPLRNQSNEIIGVLGLYEDVTERHQTETQLRLAASVFSHAREAILIASTDAKVMDVNAMFREIFGYARDEVIGRNLRMLKSNRHERTFFVHMWRSLIKNGHWNGEIWYKRKDGSVFPAMMTISAVKDDQNRTQQYVALISDISAIKAHERRLEHIAHYDALTGLPNRVLLADRLHQAMLQARRQEQLLAVAYLDLDGFKVVNDNYGHEVGDQLLTAISARMKLALRESDTFARLGGDEFVAVLPDLADTESSEPLLERLLEAANQPIDIGGIAFQVSASIGVTFYEPDTADEDADQLLRQADQAMYQAKLAGRNRFHVFDFAQDKSLRVHHEQIEQIKHALAADEFVLFYQPKVNMRTGKVVGAEALIRWQHPQKGLLPPGEFLPVIEDHPLAVDLGEWVIATALKHLADWQNVNLDIPVSVNMGARQLQQSNFIERLQFLLATQPQVSPSRLQLEVLETSALQDIKLISSVLSACRAMGVTSAIDDFGTGYSSLTYLKRLPVDTLKIDQSFVRDMLEDPDDMAILQGVLGLARAFKREAIAEGVESVVHGAVLLDLGCDLAQGYGIARPMPVEDFPEWVKNWRPDPSWQTGRQDASH